MKNLIYINKDLQILEIGLFQGFSSNFILTNLPKSYLTYADTWDWSDEHINQNSKYKKMLNIIKSNFKDCRS